MNWTTDLLEATNGTMGLWTAIAALAAAVAAAAAVASNRMTNQVLRESRAKERPWLNTSKTTLVNRPGGFSVDLAIRNYGASVATQHRMKAWRCHGASSTVLYQGSSATEIVPTQKLVWPLDCDNFTPSEVTYLVVRLGYEDTGRRPFETWLFYNWPVNAQGALGKFLVHADVELAEKIRVALGGT